MKPITVACLVLISGCARDVVTNGSSGPLVTPVRQPAATRPAAIDSFQGEYRFLSNFWPAEVEFEGITYPTAEHAYQAAKTLDAAERKRIAALATPADAKRAGRAVQPLRADWEMAKFDVMERCVRDKFTRHADLRQRLLATGDAELIEGNTWGDRIWGVYQGEGENRLGKILMNVRAELRGG
jgi:ribA/ribD-fused uncharacterized protein